MVCFSVTYVVLFDGTNNTPESGTNINAMFQGLPGEQMANNFTNDIDTYSTIKSSQQVVSLYVAGIGTSGPGMNTQKATGQYLEKYALCGYEFLSRSYKTGDEIQIYGYSRGATQARILAGYIASYGLSLENVNGHFEKTLIDPSHVSVTGTMAPVAFLGLFDSVSSLMTSTDVAGKAVGGIIGSIFKRHLDKRLTSNAPLVTFDINLLGKVNVIRHAVAINEYREDFSYDPIKQYANSSEMLFLGSHGDIGGGGNRQRQFIALDWMLDQTTLPITRNYRLEPKAPITDTLTGLFAVSGPHERTFPTTALFSKNANDVATTLKVQTTSLVKHDMQPQLQSVLNVK